MNIDQIIGKVLGDGPSGEEKAALDTWKKEAEDNIKALEDIRKIAALSDEEMDEDRSCSGDGTCSYICI